MKKDTFKMGCFCGDWSEYDVDARFTQEQRKDLATLLLELDDIKKDFEKIIEKKDRLKNLMKFYNGGIVTEH